MIFVMYVCFLNVCNSYKLIKKVEFDFSDLKMHFVYSHFRVAPLIATHISSSIQTVKKLIFTHSTDVRITYMWQ